MQSDENQTFAESKQTAQRRNYDLYFYEQIGSRLYLRITRLGVIVIVLLTVIPITLMLLLLLFISPAKETKPDITIRTLPARSPVQRAIKPYPPAPSPRNK